MERNMPTSSDVELVQTELSLEEYERLRSVAEQEGKSLEELLRDAATAYTRSYCELDPGDPLFYYQPDGAAGADLSAEKTDEYHYDTDQSPSG